MHLNKESHPYLVTYDTNNAENRPTTDNTYLLARGETDYDYWFCQFSDHNSFKIFPIDTIVDAETLARVKNKQAYLVLDNANECFYSSVDGIYKYLVIEAGIPASQIILVSGGYDIADYVRKFAQQIGQDLINVEWFNGQEFSVNRQLSVNQKNFVGKTLQKKTYTKKFLNLNRRWRLHRPSMLALLYEADVIKDGHVSFDTDDFGKSWDEVWMGLDHYFKIFPDMHARMIKGYNVKHLLPLIVDTEDLKVNKDFIMDSLDPFYLETYFGLVSETTFATLHNSDGRFLTEKTFKSIASAHPFILVAPPRSMELLRNIGYKTFDGLINESYDQEHNDGKRMTMIVDEVKRLCNLSESELDHFLIECAKICEYNFNLLKTRETFIQQMIWHAN
jgi:hypothetical protein